MSKNISDQDKIIYCFFCGKQCNNYRYKNIDSSYSYLCFNCGEVSINESFQVTIDSVENPKSVKRFLSFYYRTRTENKLKAETVNWDNYKQLISSIYIPKTLDQKIDFIIKTIGNRSRHFGAMATFYQDNDFVLFNCENSLELKNVLSALAEEKLIEPFTRGGQLNIKLSHKGWRYFESNRSINLISNQAFIAMSFSPEMITQIAEVVPDIVIKAGFVPKLIINKEHNNNIVDEIIAEIRNSKFIIVDFTEHRNSVYFEAGFAYGLGLPVIWMCSNKDFKDGKTAFDTNHFNHIIWDSPDDLRTKLYNRIKATIL